MGPGKSQPAITYVLAIFLVIDPHIPPPPHTPTRPPFNSSWKERETLPMCEAHPDNAIACLQGELGFFFLPKQLLKWCFGPFFSEAGHNLY